MPTTPSPGDQRAPSLPEPLSALENGASLISAFVLAEALAPPLALRPEPHDRRA